MRSAKIKINGVYLIWLGLIAATLPYYLGTLIAQNAWHHIGALLFVLLLGTLFFIEMRYLILCCVLSFLLVGSTVGAPSSLRWVFLGLLALKSIVHWLSKRLPIHLRMVDFFFSAFIGVAFYSQTYSFLPATTLERSISVLLLYIATLWGVWDYADDGEKASTLIRDLCKAAFCILIASFLQFSLGRFKGIFASPGSLGLFCTLVFPLFLWRYFNEKKTWLLMGMVLALVESLLSGARAGILVCGCSGGYLLWYRYRDRKYLVFLWWAITISVVFFIGSLFDFPGFSIVNGFAGAVLVRGAVVWRRGTWRHDSLNRSPF